MLGQRKRTNRLIILRTDKAIWNHSPYDYEIDLHSQEEAIIRDREDSLAKNINSTFRETRSAFLGLQKSISENIVMHFSHIERKS